MAKRTAKTWNADRCPNARRHPGPRLLFKLLSRVYIELPVCSSSARQCVFLREREMSKHRGQGPFSGDTTEGIREQRQAVKKPFSETIRRTADEAKTAAPQRPDEDAAGSAGGSSGIAVSGWAGGRFAGGLSRVFSRPCPPTAERVSWSSSTWLPPTRVCCRNSLRSTPRMKVVQAQDAVPVSRTLFTSFLPITIWVFAWSGFIWPSQSRRAHSDAHRLLLGSLAEIGSSGRWHRLFRGRSYGTLGVRRSVGVRGVGRRRKTRTRQFRTDAPQRDCHRLGRLRPSARSNAEALLEYLRHPYVRGREPAAVLEAEGKREASQDILALVLASNELRLPLLQEDDHLEAHSNAGWGCTASRT